MEASLQLLIGCIHWLPCTQWGQGTVATAPLHTSCGSPLTLHVAVARSISGFSTILGMFPFSLPTSDFHQITYLELFVLGPVAMAQTTDATQL